MKRILSFSARYLAVGALLATLSTSACDCSAYQRNSRIQEAGSTLAGHLAAVTLAKAPVTKRLLRPTPLLGVPRVGNLRLAVVGGKAYLDNTDWLVALQENNNPTLAGLDGEGIEAYLVSVADIDLTSGDVAAANVALKEALDRAVDIEAKLVENPRALVEVYVEAEAPLDTVSRLFSTLAASKLATYGFAFDTKELPGIIDLPAGLGCPTGGKGVLDCAVPELSIVPEGMMMRARALPLDEGVCDGVLSALARGESLATQVEGSEQGDEQALSEDAKKGLRWDGNILLGKAGGCPSVAKDEGAHNPRGLGMLIRDIAAMSPGCDVAIIRGTSAVRWHEVGVAISVLNNRTPYQRVLVTLSQEQAVAANCEGAIIPAKLPAVMARRAEDAKRIRRLSIMGIVEQDLAGP